ncbi:hypothetical protein [Chryseobacterium sp. SIMBA_029]|uniref:hypothetical protein n=2 Tax=Bacteria TaxID=2 RepID=UPI00397E1CE6
MKNAIFTFLILVPVLSAAQVGINTVIPSATLDITAKNITGTDSAVDGLLIPRVDRERAQSMSGIPVSTLIYVNNIATGSLTGTALNIDAVGYYYFNGTVWTKLNLPVNIYNSNGTLSGNRVVTTGGNLLSFTNGANTINIGTTGTESIVRAIGSSRGTIRTQGGSAIIDLFVDNANSAQLATSGNATSLNLSTQAAAPVNFITNTAQRATISATGNFGINTTGPTHKLHVVPSAGDDPVKVEGLKTASGAENNVVVDISTGILKYSPTVAQPLFHAKLAANQTSLTGTNTILLGTPEATSSLYSYNTATGVMTFNNAGNYLVQMQMSFRNVSANEQVIIGIRDVSGDFIGRGSTRIATTIPVSATVGQIHNYNTVISVTAGQQITFAANGINTYALLRDEIGTIGTGNVSNITVIKL